MFFSFFIEIFSSIFFTFVTSLIKHFIINVSDLQELYMYILNIKGKWFCIKSSLESRSRKPKIAACDARSNRVKLFSKNKSSSFHKFWTLLPSWNRWSTVSSEILQKRKRDEVDFQNLKAFYLNKEHYSGFYIERKVNNCLYKHFSFFVMWRLEFSSEFSLSSALNNSWRSPSCSISTVYICMHVHNA